MSCPLVWHGSQPVTHIPTGPGVSHGGPGDGKETHKHEQVGRAIWGEGGGLPGAPSMSSHTPAPLGLLARCTSDCAQHVPWALRQLWEHCQLL